MAEATSDKEVVPNTIPLDDDDDEDDVVVDCTRRSGLLMRP